MMNPEDRKAHWDGVYSRNAPTQVSWFQSEPALSLQMIEDTGIGRDAPIIDIGGGASVLVDRLHGLGYSRLAVLDISAKSLEHAKTRLGPEQTKIDWYGADVTQFHPPHDFALWHDRAVFHFLTEASDRRKYVATLRAALQPRGHVVLAAFAIGGPVKCSGLEIVQYDADKLLSELGDGFELLDQRIETHRTPGGKDQAFACFRLLRT